MSATLKFGKLVLAALLVAQPLAAIAATDPDAVTRALEQVNRRLEALEQRNEQLAAQVDELTKQNQELRAGAAPTATAPAAPPAAPSKPVAPVDDWPSRIKFGGDFRFRHESTDNSALANERTREAVRVRMNAAIKVNDSMRGEIGIATGARDPRGANATMGEAEARKEIGLDLGYLTWQALDSLSLTVGKMREPYTRPGRSLFFDNEIRPEGMAANYKDGHGVFVTAFNFWLEERALLGDSMLSGGQAGWDGSLGAVRLKAGVGYWDYRDVQGRFPGFGNSILSELGNSITGTGASARYVYDYNIGQAFAEATFSVAELPLTLFVDYGRNFEADNGLDSAYSFGFILGKAGKVGQWEAGILKQRVEKDALFAQWTDSEFAGGVTDNDGYAARVAWMAMKNFLISANYYDTEFNVDVGNQADFNRWQLEFNYTY